LKLDDHLLLMDSGGVPYSELHASLELMGVNVLPHFHCGAEEPSGV
jgi:hypothetical protein